MKTNQVLTALIMVMVSSKCFAAEPYKMNSALNHPLLILVDSECQNILNIDITDYVNSNMNKDIGDGYVMRSLQMNWLDCATSLREKLVNLINSEIINFLKDYPDDTSNDSAKDIPSMFTKSESLFDEYVDNVCMVKSGIWTGGSGQSTQIGWCTAQLLASHLKMLFSTYDEYNIFNESTALPENNTIPPAPGGLAARCCTRTQATTGATKTCTTGGHSYTCNCGSGACW